MNQEMPLDLNTPNPNNSHKVEAPSTERPKDAQNPKQFDRPHNTSKTVTTEVPETVHAEILSIQIDGMQTSTYNATVGSINSTALFVSQIQIPGKLMHIIMFNVLKTEIGTFTNLAY